MRRVTPSHFGLKPLHTYPIVNPNGHFWRCSKPCGTQAHRRWKRPANAQSPSSLSKAGDLALARPVMRIVGAGRMQAG
jgi:hypothetical protein